MTPAMPPEGPQQPHERFKAHDERPAMAHTNKVAMWSLASSFVGLAMILPVAGSILGILGGKRAVKQIDQTGEGGGGIAEAAIVFGWFGLVSSSIGLIGIVAIVVAAARSKLARLLGAASPAPRHNAALRFCENFRLRAKIVSIVVAFKIGAVHQEELKSRMLIAMAGAMPTYTQASMLTNRRSLVESRQLPSPQRRFRRFLAK